MDDKVIEENFRRGTEYPHNIKILPQRIFINHKGKEYFIMKESGKQLPYQVTQFSINSNVINWHSTSNWHGEKEVTSLRWYFCPKCLTWIESLGNNQKETIRQIEIEGHFIKQPTWTIETMPIEFFKKGAERLFQIKREWMMQNKI